MQAFEVQLDRNADIAKAKETLESVFESLQVLVDGNRKQLMIIATTKVENVRAYLSGHYQVLLDKQAELVDWARWHIEDMLDF